MKKLLLTLILGIFLFSLASADLGTFKQGNCISLYQYCDDCTYVNLTTVQYPNGTIETINEAMTKNDVDYNYTFCSTNDLGTYYYVVKGDAGGSTTTERLGFEITGGGTEASVPQAIMYGIVLFILLILFLGSFIWFNGIQWGHYTSSEGNIIQVNTDRTKKIILFFTSYILFLLLLFTGKSMTENLMFINDTPVFFDVFFTILLVSIAPVTIAIIAITILVTIADSKLQKAIFRGLEIR
jgi:hypothetical protein